VVYRVLVWIEDSWIPGRLRSELNEAIWWALKDAGVVIAFPQLDGHGVTGPWRLPDPQPEPLKIKPPERDRVLALPHVAGLHHEYRRAA
jgi:hypothetical protein